MASTYGDSSDSEAESFASTNVLLGYASKEPTDDDFSQLGGDPVGTMAPPNPGLALLSDPES